MNSTKAATSLAKYAWGQWDEQNLRGLVTGRNSRLLNSHPKKRRTGRSGLISTTPRCFPMATFSISTPTATTRQRLTRLRKMAAFTTPSIPQTKLKDGGDRWNCAVWRQELIKFWIMRMEKHWDRSTLPTRNWMLSFRSICYWKLIGRRSGIADCRLGACPEAL